MGVLKLLPHSFRLTLLRKGLVEAIEELEELHLGLDVKQELEQKFGAQKSLAAKQRIAYWLRKMADELEG